MLLNGLIVTTKGELLTTVPLQTLKPYVSPHRRQVSTYSHKTDKEGQRLLSRPRIKFADFNGLEQLNPESNQAEL